jgi:hypothetical protein
MNVRFSYSAGNFWNGWETVSFSRRILFPGVSDWLPNLPPHLTLSTHIYIFVAQLIYAFRTILATNSHHFPIQHSLIDITKKNFCMKILCPKMIGFVFNWKIAFNNKYLNYVTFFLHLTQYISNISFQFNNCQVLSVSQVSIHNRYFKYLPAESKRFWTCLIMKCYLPLRSRSGCE